MCLVTALYEGTEEEVAYQQKSIKRISKKHKGFRAGAESGQRAYFLTYMIAYIRDYGFQFSFFAESFETSCSWKNVPTLCQNVN
jgi:alkyldihydroxyacetonephosphate synthase